MSNRVLAFLAVSVVSFGAGGSPVVWAEVTEISGHAAAQVVQFENGNSIQSDFAQEGLDLTSVPNQALATAKLETFATDGSQTAGGSSLAVLRPQARGIFALPNDVGFDLAVFSTDPNFYWQASGEAVETRSIVLKPRDTGGGFINGDTARFQSRLVLTGVLLVLTNDAALDLTGTEVRFQFSVTKHGGTLPDETLLLGSATLTGGPDDSLTVTKSDALANAILPIITVPSSVPGLSTVRLIVFPGLQLPYEYDAVLGEEFTIELVTGAEMETSPGGIGAAAVFGLPIEGLPDVLSKTRNDDSGAKIKEIVDEHVDTTGRAYSGGAGSPLGIPLPATCGAMGLEAVVPALVSVVAMCGPAVWRKRRVRRGK